VSLVKSQRQPDQVEVIADDVWLDGSELVESSKEPRGVMLPIRS
jgi:hypothetical protein